LGNENIKGRSGTSVWNCVKEFFMKRIVLILAAVLFSSCIGIKTEITVGRDLSGTVNLAYTVSEELLKSGTLDGNENWPALPVGKADLERTVARVDGLTLRSYRERKAGDNRLFEAVLAFDNIASLAGFFGANGNQFRYANENGRHVLTVVFNDGTRTLDDTLAALAQTAFSGYQFDFSISVPGEKKHVSMPMADILTTSQKEGLEISF
jgi:hypothetical protein